jgi:ABC-type sugar transport system permease subunit
MEYINIISKEAITQAFAWPVVLVGCLAIAAMIMALVWAIITKRMDEMETGRLFGVIGVIGIGCLIITILVCAIFFQVPTGRYKYEATIDKDKITVSEYEQFIEEYNPTIKNGVYYWED